MGQRQSRKAFLIDTIGRTLSSAIQLQLSSPASTDYFKRSIRGMYEAAKGIDKKLAEQLREGWIRWGSVEWAERSKAGDRWQLFEGVAQIFEEKLK